MSFCLPWRFVNYSLVFGKVKPVCPVCPDTAIGPTSTEFIRRLRPDWGIYVLLKSWKCLSTGYTSFQYGIHS